MDIFHRLLLLVWSLCCWETLAVKSNSPKSSLRLFGGAGRCQGELQVYRSDVLPQRWISVFPLMVPQYFGHRLCAELDCGPALTVDEIQVPNREAVALLHGNCEDSSLDQCFMSDAHSLSRALLLHCHESVRLVSGQNQCSGSLQVRDHRSSEQSWSWVCEGALDRRGAEVLCRELGCGAPLLQGALSAQMFHCEGHESALMDCPRNQTRTHCSGPVLNLTCSEPLRLVGGASGCEGAVELKHRGHWRRMTTDGRWDMRAAAGVCQRLDCGSALSTVKRADYNQSQVWALIPDCEQRAPLRDCVISGFEASVGLDVLCSESVRLVSGQNQCSGSLQVRDHRSSEQSWSWVCEGALDRRGAEVLCRELGCGAPLLQGALSAQMFHCEGHESALMDCPRNQTRTHCSGPVLNLTCSEPLRLVGGASGCEGTVELNYRGEWRELVSPRYPWSSDAAAAVCPGLGCGSAVSTIHLEGSGRRQVWAIRSECVKGTAVKDCVFGEVRGRLYSLKVVCSGNHGRHEDTQR